MKQVVLNTCITIENPIIGFLANASFRKMEYINGSCIMAISINSNKYYKKSKNCNQLLIHQIRPQDFAFFYQF